MFNPEHAQLCALSGTPAYVFDTDVFRDRIARTSRLLGSRAKLCYAMKANPFLAGTAELDRYEVCSPGEFAICERIGIPMSRIVLSGVYKAETDLKRVIPAYGKLLTFTAESLRQFQQINAIAQANGLCVRLLLRLSSGNQFGIERNEIIDLIKNRSLFTGVDIIGLQHFSGTQRHSLGKYEKELRMLDELLDELQESGYEAQELEFGPGFYVEYFQNQKPYDEDELVSGFARLLEQMRFKGKIILELGRFLAAACGTYYTAVCDMKENGGRQYCITDGGKHQLSYFGAMMGMKHPFVRVLSPRLEPAAPIPYTVCGALCTVNDILAQNLPLPRLEPGDILEFQRAGAYCMCEGISLFLSRDLPKIFLYSEQEGLIRLRGKIETYHFNMRQEEDNNDGKTA